MLLLPMVPGLGVNVNGARIWVSLGPLNFQPGEFAKLALAIFFAAYLAERRELIAASTWKVGPFRLPETAVHRADPVGVGVRRDGDGRRARPRLVAAVLHPLRRDDVGRDRARQLPGDRVRAVRPGGVPVVARMFDHVQTRVDIWLDPWADEYGTGFQIVQALYGLGDGGIVGTGLGRGSPDKVPEAQNDFIFAAIGEEMGLIGATTVLMAYLLLIGAGLRIALRTDRTFEKLLAVGLTTIVGMQAFIIVGGVIKVVPLTGITLPFVSYGGSSLLSNYILLAILLRLSDTAPAASANSPTTRPRANAGPPGGSAVRTRRERPSRTTTTHRSRRPYREPGRSGSSRAALIACTSCCSRRSTTGRSTAPRSRRPNRQHPRTDPAVRHAPRADRDRRRRGGCPVGTGAGRQRRQVRADVPDRRPVRRHHRLLHVRLGATQLERSKSDVLTGTRSPSRSAALENILGRTNDNSGDCASRCATTCRASPSSCSAHARARSC